MQGQIQVRGRGVGTVFDGQAQALAPAAQEEAGVRPSVELARAAQGLTGADLGRALAGVVHEGDGAAVATLDLTQAGQQGHDRGRDVLIDAVQAYKRIEDEQHGLQRRDGGRQSAAIGLDVQAHGGCGDEPQVELGQGEVGVGTEALESLAHHVQSVFSGEQEHAAGAVRCEAIETGTARGDRDGHGQGEERLAGLRFPADGAHRVGTPQVLDEPALLGGAALELMSGQDG